MKHTLLLIPLLLSAVSLCAAESVPVMQLDSIITEVEDINLRNTKQEFAVDATGQVEVQRSYYWNKTSRKWVPNYKYEQTRNEQGRMIAYIYYAWQNDVGDWMAFSKSRYSYDSKGRMICETTDSWDDQTQCWENGSIYERAYDERGQTLLSTDTYWDRISKQWVGSSKYEYTYNENYQQTAFTSYTWNKTTNDWVGQRRQVTVYSTLGSTEEYIDQTWDVLRGQWTNSSKTVYNYDDSVYYFSVTRYSWNSDANLWEPTTRNENGNFQEDFCSISRECTWNPDRAAWELSSMDSTLYSQDGHTSARFSFEFIDGGLHMDGTKTVVEYNEEGKNIRQLTYRWNETDTTWAYESDQRYEYDAFGNQTSTMSYTWGTATNDWIGVRKRATTYDATHTIDALKAFRYDVNYSSGRQLPTSVKEYYWFEEYSMWYPFPYRATQYYYSAYSPLDAAFSDKKLEVYLNPVTDLMTVNDEALLEGGDTVLPLVSVHDIRGSLLLSTTLRVIDFSRYPDGMYFVSVNGRSCRVIKR
jgi:hypothetical protein